MNAAATRKRATANCRRRRATRHLHGWRVRVRAQLAHRLECAVEVVRHRERVHEDLRTNERERYSERVVRNGRGLYAKVRAPQCHLSARRHEAARRHWPTATTLSAGTRWDGMGRMRLRGGG